MKTFVFTLFIITCFLSGSAQNERYNYPDAFYFVKEVTLTPGESGNFKFNLSVKENPSDNLSKVRIYAVQVRSEKEDIIGNTLVYANASGTTEKTYTVEGSIHPEAKRIWLYVAVNGNGNFYFDNIEYFNSTATGWQAVTLQNSSFEDAGKNLLKGYYVSKKSVPQLQVNSSSHFATHGKNSLHVFTAGMKAVAALAKAEAITADY
jgi:hypothetical protein